MSIIETRQPVPTYVTTRHKESVRAFFDSDPNWKWDVYRNEADPHARGVRRRMKYILAMLDALTWSRNAEVLDVGCGPGAYLEELAHRGFRCTGIDLSPEMLQVCRTNLHPTGSIRTLQGDIEAIPVDARSIDLLLCIGVLQYLDSPLLGLSEISRVTKEGAVVVLCVENLLSLGNLDWFLRRKISALWNRNDNPTDGVSMISDYFLNRPVGAHRYRLYNPWRLDATMKQSGFEMIDAMTYGFGFTFLRSLRILPDTLLDRLELFLEKVITSHSLPYFGRSGEFYIGMYRKKSFSSEDART
jgi:ubiquinone/menaquinone biosynthesis C-methylase UbiE